MSPSSGKAATPALTESAGCSGSVERRSRIRETTREAMSGLPREHYCKFIPPYRAAVSMAGMISQDFSDAHQGGLPVKWPYWSL